ncbi:hypothetical protein PFISCL1PPCAC_14217, partial [Pristionchus fissidentatus]
IGNASQWSYHFLLAPQSYGAIGPTLSILLFHFGSSLILHVSIDRDHCRHCVDGRRRSNRSLLWSPSLLHSKMGFGLYKRCFPLSRPHNVAGIFPRKKFVVLVPFLKRADSYPQDGVCVFHTRGNANMGVDYHSRVYSFRRINRGICGQNLPPSRNESKRFPRVRTTNCR